MNKSKSVNVGKVSAKGLMKGLKKPNTKVTNVVNNITKVESKHLDGFPCKSCLGRRLHSMFDWFDTNYLGDKAIGFDKTDNTITVDEQKLMKIIQMINPAQPERKIKLINTSDKGD